MSHEEDKPRLDPVPAGEGDQVARLLRLAGRRPPVPKEVAARVWDSTHEAWRGAVARRRRRGWLWSLTPLAAAAALFLLIGMPRHPREAAAPAPELAPVGELEVVLGTVRRLVDGDGPARVEQLQEGDLLPAGARVEAAEESRTALRLANGSSLRLAAGTLVRLESPTEVVLERGRLYIDSGGEGDGSPGVRVRTAVGLVQELGTQFEVRTLDDRVRVRVREGSVVLDRQGRSYQAVAGGELIMDANGALTRGTVAPFGGEWNWVMEIAPSFRLEGTRLDRFLTWVGRETGWRVEFEDQELAADSAATVLHGSIEGLRPDQALEAVLPTCGLAYELRDGLVRIVAASV